MMSQPPDEPIFSWGSIDVVVFDKKEKRMGLAVHVACYADNLESEETKEKARVSVEKMLGEMKAEGLISSSKGWHISIAIVGHSPAE